MILKPFVARLDAPPSAGADGAEVFAALGEGPSRWAAATAGRAVAAVLGVMATERAAWLAPLLRPAVERTVVDLLLAVSDSADHIAPARLMRSTEVRNPQERELVIALALDDAPFGRIAEGLRIVQSTCTAELLNTAERHRPTRERVLLLRGLTEVVAGFFDARVGAVIAQYLQERERLISSRLTARRTVVEAILAGTPVSEEDARRSLGLDLAAPHLALVAWRAGSPARQPGPGEFADSESAARWAGEVLRCRSNLSLPAEDGLWIWLSRADPFTERDLQTLRTAETAPDGVRLAVGAPGRGAAGFRRSHLTAQDAARVARTSRTAQAGVPVTVYRDIGLTALLLADPERARWFVAEELGRLAGQDSGARDLRRTVLSYLDEGSSLVAAAAALHVHRNTVVYRLGRAEELLGRPLTERTLPLHAALQLAEVLE